ncbi:MAG TPA: endonuclease/exonuclease/phosphatase family protein, partial [Verrucomicrobiae bacterium]|nr:endonuclease/exonuclease/phosphatase family protein [Verrucomicrobiae bacterium]
MGGHGQLWRFSARSLVFALTLLVFSLPLVVQAQLPVPGPPSSLAAAVDSPTSVGLSWQDTSIIETGFKIERAPDSGGNPGTWSQIGTVGYGVTTYVDGGRTSNTIYWYRVRAYNASGNSAYSNVVSLMPTAGQTVRVMQWNIEGNLGRLASNTTVAALAIARIVSYNQPDILLFNEIDARIQGPGDNEAALIDWATNSVPYLATQTFFVAVSPASDGYERNAAISRFPISNEVTYGDGLRGLHAFTVQLADGKALQVFQAHLKCCNDRDSCSRRQYEAQFDADNISAWASTNTLPYIFGGDWNEDEDNPDCTLTTDYHPITTIREDGHLVEFRPITLDAVYGTCCTYYWVMPSSRYDYMLAATNRLAPATGYVFDSRAWSNHGLYNGYYDSYDSSDHYCVFADYFFPQLHFGVTPTNAFASIGFPGGPFGPASQMVYTLSNTNSLALHWGVSHDGSWISLSATNGVLAAGASTNITAFLNSAATSLSVSNYTDNIRFSDTLAGGLITRYVNLTVQDVNNLSPFQLWQMRYFSSISAPAAQPTADADGTGQDNLFKFEAGLDPTNRASVFRITSLSREGANLRVMWSCVASHTYFLQGSIRTAAPGYTNVFFDISPPITAGGSGESTTNFLVPGALTRPGPADSGPITLPSGGGQSSSTQLTV